MAHLIENDFTSYAMTEEEALQGSILTIGQKQVIQNQLAIVAAEKLSLEFDTAKPAEFTQQEAYKKGQLDVLRFLLESSDASEEELRFKQNPNLDSNL